MTRAPRPRVLAIGGLDPSGGAGITADVRVIQRLGGEALAVATCLTVQNRWRFERAEPVDARLLRAMLDAVAADGPVDSIKTGLFAAAESIRAVAGWLAEVARDTPVVVDPVLSSTMPGFGGEPACAAALRDGLAPLATLITPNLDELERLTRAGARELVAAGCRGVLVKDGHGAGPIVADRLVTLDGERVFAHPRQARGPVHGTGCALATAIAVELGRGADLVSACATGVDHMGEWLERTPTPPIGAAAALRIQ
jgi:hydroxymethylpyrimidine/phosphomethylpyrimidine kinase